MDISSSDSECNEPSPLRKRRKLNNDRQRLHPRSAAPSAIRAPPAGLPVDRRKLRRAGRYIIGPEVVGVVPVKCLVQYIAKREKTNQFYLLKIVQESTDPNVSDQRLQDELRGKALLHTEYSLLSLLKKEPGIVKEHGMFSDFAYEDTVTADGKCVYTGVTIKRHILVLDCLMSHSFCKSNSYINLEEYIKRVKKIPENCALFMFHAIVKIIERIHQKNIIHKDLKTTNIILNTTAKKITIANFWLGRFISNEGVIVPDQSGTPAYIAPEVFLKKPYKGKPSDMWSLGIILYLMIYGKFPFFEPTINEIISGKFDIPENDEVSPATVEILKGLLNTDPERRMTAAQVRAKLESIFIVRRARALDQYVPQGDVNQIPSEISENSPSTSNCHQVFPKFNSNENQPSKAPLTLKAKEVFYIDHLISKYSWWLNVQREYSKDISIIVTRKPTELYPFVTQLLDTGSRLRIIKSENKLIIEVVVGVSPETISKEKRQREEFIKAVGSYLATNPQIRIFKRYKEFDGVLTIALAKSLYRWITKVFKDTEVVQNFLINSNRSLFSRLVEFFERCQVGMSLGPIIAGFQPDNDIKHLLILMLKSVGYDENFFSDEKAQTKNHNIVIFPKRRRR
ncbi:serine/threonine-protein kinase 40-like isoform X1 [Hermetia illucens]|uniref:serine/threonine-protein kinase 40-like isoform X1 n=1 Tax=Hermetia illucens TaxID=343691 RepID=UPI0018CC023D|nr:serine/threonine-protein kinase 40-like isoform X1 [Hermetia illucens]